MARTGLYITEVKKARDVLLKAGKHPSVDAVRVALGNTGSKTTIHKYLKQLETEDPIAGTALPTLSDRLATMVAEVATQLEREASVQIDAMRLEASQARQEHVEAAKVICAERDSLLAQLRRVEAAASTEATAHEQTRHALQNESIARMSAEQRVEALQERLVENDKHLQSIEEKHQHARASLEHFREAAREQREQEVRRHEHQVQQLQADLRSAQQVQVVKQEEITLLNRESARMAAGLQHAEKMLQAEQELAQRLAAKVATLEASEVEGRVLEEKFVNLSAQEAVLRHAEVALRASHEYLIHQVRDLELALARAQSRLDVLAEPAVPTQKTEARAAESRGNSGARKTTAKRRQGP
jgi:DNA repair exonuclease SbcCD ATPase subunit